MYALQNDRIGNANSSFNSLKSRFMSQRLSHQVNQSVQLNNHEIRSLKRIVRKNHQKQHDEDQQQFQNKSQICFSSRQHSNLRQAENNLIMSKKELRKQQYHSRAESQILHDRSTLNTSINNHFNTSYLQGKIQTTKNQQHQQNTPIKHDFRIKTTQNKSRKKQQQLRSPSVNKQLANDHHHRISMNEFKVPFHIYQQQDNSNYLTQVNSPSNNLINNTFTSKSLLKSRQVLKRGNSQNDMRYNSITKKNNSPKFQDKSRSRERSIKSSLSNRSKIYNQNFNNKSINQEKTKTSHQPKLRKLRMAALKEFQKDGLQGNQTDRHANQFMKIVEESQVSNFDNNINTNRNNQQSQRGQKTQLNIKHHNIENLINNTSVHPQTVKNQNTQHNQNNLLSLINNGNLTATNTHHQQYQQQNKSISPRNNHQNIQSIANNVQVTQQPVVSYKKIFDEVNSENIALRTKMQQMLDEQNKKQSQINKIKIKTAQAQSDKIELMRDLATYESNFSDNCGVRSVLLQIHKKIQNVKQQIEKESRGNQIKGMFKGNEKIQQFGLTKKQSQVEDESWLNDKQKQTIFKHLSELSILKRERGSVSDAIQSDIFLNSGNLHQQSPMKNAPNQMFFNKNKKNQITPRDDNKGSYEEQLYHSTSISGIHCTIQANLLNGIVQVIVQTNIDHKQHKIEIKPLNNKVKISLKREISRLQFVLENQITKRQTQIAQLPWQNRNQNTQNRKQKLILKASDTYEDDKNLQTILSIPGCKQQFCEVYIIQEQDKQEENHNVNILIKNNSQEYQITLKSEKQLSSKEIFNLLQSQYVFRDLQNGEQQLINILEHQNQHINSQKWLKKIQNNQQLSDKTIDYVIDQDANKNNQQQHLKNNNDTVTDSDSQNEDDNEDMDTPGGRNKQYLQVNQNHNDEISPNFNNQSRAALELINQKKKQSMNQILMNQNIDEYVEESSVSEHDNDNVVFSPNKIDDVQMQIKVIDNNVEDLDETLQFNNQEGIYELNQELQDISDVNQRQSQLEFKRIKSYNQIDQELDDKALDALAIKCIKSQSNNNLNANHLLSMQNSSSRKQQSSSRLTENQYNQQLQQSLENQILQQYEYLYHYKWYANNRQYYLVAKARQEELERLKRIEEEEKERVRMEQEKEHDEKQLYVILQQLEQFRDYFKGPQAVAFMKFPMLHQDEFDYDDKTKVTIFVYPIIYEDQTEDLQFLINKYTFGEKEQIVSSRRSSAMRANSFESIIINKHFLENLGLLRFKTVDFVQKHLQEFVHNQAFQQIVKHHITQCIIEKTLQSKTFEQHHQPMSQLQVNPGIRKMDSEFKNANTIKDNNTANSITVTVRGYEKTSSDFGDTSMNDSYSKYLK